MKFEVLLHYTRLVYPKARKPRCEVKSCGFSDIRALSIEHPNGGGNKHRRELAGGANVTGMNFYLKLKRMGYPPGFGVLCLNCQSIKLQEAAASQ